MSPRWGSLGGFGEEFGKRIGRIQVLPHQCQRMIALIDNITAALHQLGATKKPPWGELGLCSEQLLSQFLHKLGLTGLDGHFARQG